MKKILMYKISSHSAMSFFILLTICGGVASVLSGETHVAIPPLSQFTLLAAMIGMWFCGASAMADKNRKSLNNLMTKGVTTHEEDCKV